WLGSQEHAGARGGSERYFLREIENRRGHCGIGVCTAAQRETVKHIRIMIADDHPVWADGLGGLLSRMGFTICPAAATPDEIIPKASKSHPDICLLDVS